MKLLKKNQVIIYVIVFMLMAAGYLNYTSNVQNNQSVETAMQMEGDSDMQLADIGDAELVSSSDIVEDTNTNNNTNANEVAANTTTNNNVTEQTNSNVSDDYFTKSKLERDKMYSQMLETYEKVLNSTNAIDTQKQSATEEIQKINEVKNSIMICENLIQTKGFNENIVFVNGNSISVIVGVPEIKQEEVAQIQNIISREMNVQIENIHIATK